MSSSFTTSSQASSSSRASTDTGVQGNSANNTQGSVLLGQALNGLGQAQELPVSRFVQANGAPDASAPSPLNVTIDNRSEGRSETAFLDESVAPASRFIAQTPNTSESVLQNLWDDDRPLTRDRLMEFGVSASEDVNDDTQWGLPHNPVYAFDLDSLPGSIPADNNDVSLDDSSSFLQHNDELPPGFSDDLMPFDPNDELPPGMTPDMLGSALGGVGSQREDRFEQEYDASDGSSHAHQAIAEETGVRPAHEITVQRGQEFEQLGELLRDNPSKQIGQVNYQTDGRNEGARDFGGPLREFFSQAFTAGLDSVGQPIKGLGGRYDVVDHCAASTVAERAEHYRALGSLLALTADHERINLPDKIALHSLESMFILSNHLEALGIAALNSPTQIRDALTQKLSADQGAVVDLVKNFAPAVFNYYFSDADNPKETFLQHQAKAPPSELINQFSAHLAQSLGIAYSAENKQFQVPDDNTRFEQLALMAHGFHAVRQARTEAYGATYPATVEALRNAITGDGDIRRALGDATYERAFHIEADTDTDVTDAQKDRFADLLRNWASAKDTSDDKLSAVCRAITGADVLPARISNASNRIHVRIGDIPVYSEDETISEPLGYAEVGAHTCFGTLEVAPHVVEAILLQHQEDPSTTPPRLQKLMSEDIPELAKKFNAD